MDKVESRGFVSKKVQLDSPTFAAKMVISLLTAAFIAMLGIRMLPK